MRNNTFSLDRNAGSIEVHNPVNFIKVHSDNQGGRITEGSDM